MPSVASQAGILQSQHLGRGARAHASAAGSSASPFSQLLADDGNAGPTSRHPPSRLQPKAPQPSETLRQSEPDVAVDAAAEVGQPAAGAAKQTQRAQAASPDVAQAASVAVAQAAQAAVVAQAASVDVAQAASVDAAKAAQAAAVVLAQAAGTTEIQNGVAVASTEPIAVAIEATLKSAKEPDSSLDDVLAATDGAATDGAGTSSGAIVAPVQPPMLLVVPVTPATPTAADANALAIPPAAGLVEPTSASDNGMGAPTPAIDDAATPAAAPTVKNEGEAPTLPAQGENAAASAPSAATTPATPHAKSALAASETSDPTGNAPPPSSDTAGHGQTASAPQVTPHAQPSSGAPAKLQPHEPPERPTSPVADGQFLQAVQHAPDGLNLASMQTGRDLGQIVGTVAHGNAAADSSASTSAAKPVPVEGLAVEIATHAQAGRNRFEIRLDPPELGRIEVRLDIDRSGQVTSRLVVDRAETLDVLRRDAHQLERALQDAGLKTSDNGMQFTLRDQSLPGRDNSPAPDLPRPTPADADRPIPDAAPVIYKMALRSSTGVDISV